MKLNKKIDLILRVFKK